MHAYSHPNAELLDQPDDSGGKPLPLHVRLRSAEQQEYLAVAVLDAVDAQMQVRVRLPLIGVEDHRWSATAVVVQLIMIEFGEHLMLEVLQQVCGKQSASLPGVHKAVQLMDQHGAMVLELGYHRLVQGVELPRIHHENQSTCDCRYVRGTQLAQSPRREGSVQCGPSCSLKVVRPLSFAASSSSMPSATSERMRTAWCR